MHVVEVAGGSRGLVCDLLASLFEVRGLAYLVQLARIDAVCCDLNQSPVFETLICSSCMRAADVDLLLKLLTTFPKTTFSGSNSISLRTLSLTSGLAFSSLVFSLFSSAFSLLSGVSSSVSFDHLSHFE